MDSVSATAVCVLCAMAADAAHAYGMPYWASAVIAAAFLALAGHYIHRAFRRRG